MGWTDRASKRGMNEWFVGECKNRFYFSFFLSSEIGMTGARRGVGKGDGRMKVGRKSCKNRRRREKKALFLVM